MKPIVTFAALMAMTAPVLAQDTGAELRLGLAHNQARSENFKRVEGSFAFPFNRGISLQVDVAAAKYEGLTSTAPSAGLHLGYALSDALTLGGFVTGEDIRTGNYLYAGLEAVYDAGPLSAEGYVAHVEDLGGPLVGQRAGLDLAYGLGDLALLAGAHVNDDGAGTDGYGYVGARYAFDRGLAVDATVGQTDAGDTVFGLGLTMVVGSGVPFNRRDWRGAAPGY